jgi:hypothetical protein
LKILAKGLVDHTRVAPHTVSEFFAAFFLLKIFTNLERFVGIWLLNWILFVHVKRGLNIKEKFGTAGEASAAMRPRVIGRMFLEIYHDFVGDTGGL